MHHTTIRKAPLALLCGAMLTLALTACNRVREQMDTEPASRATAVDAMAADSLAAGPLSTMMRPALRMVLRRWAMVMTVRPTDRRSRASWIRRSLS